MNRRWELDALRGLMLLLMTLTHLPTRFSDPFGQPFGYVSAAEGFVFLSAYMAGQVYTRRHERHGAPEMRGAFLRRAMKIYLCQVALLAFLFSIIAAMGVISQQMAVINMLNFYLDKPGTAFVAGLLLIYNPPLLDILPMYILFMLASPVVLLHGLRNGWGILLGASVLLWLAAQFDIATGLYRIAVALTGLTVPFKETGAFEIVAWQFLWVLGLWMGSQDASADAPKRNFPRWMVHTALVYALVCMIWRHALGQAPFGANEGLNMLFDKWKLGPLRLIDFFSLLVLLMHYGERLKERLPRIALLETLGSAALPVFCAHLVAALLALAFVGAATPERPWHLDVVVVGASLLLLWIVAEVTVFLERRTAALRERFTARRSATWVERSGVRR